MFNFQNNKQIHLSFELNIKNNKYFKHMKIEKEKIVSTKIQLKLINLCIHICFIIL